MLDLEVALDLRRFFFDGMNERFYSTVFWVEKIQLVNITFRLDTDCGFENLPGGGRCRIERCLSHHGSK